MRFELAITLIFQSSRNILTNMSEKMPGNHSIERVMPPLGLEDAIIRTHTRDPEAATILYQADPVTWLKGAIGLDTGRGASEITDRELMIRYVGGGRFEWDPQVAKKVASYLKDQGFRWTL